MLFDASYVLALPWPVQAIAALLLILLLAFLGLFLIPAIFFRMKIARLLSRLEQMRGTNDTDPTNAFADDKTLRHLWQEYKDTLHEQTRIGPTGGRERVAFRSTVPAETFFSPQALVDSRLRTEFFKHLPGIFTGLGIIGTFFGLLDGLAAFDTKQAQDSLKPLLLGVSHAFVVSATAIGLAMLITLIEKWTIAGLYRKAEALAFLLDSMFESGAGEEYLARLVNASESSASQTKILKDSLVSDLKTVLSELTERQIRANATGNQQLGSQIAQSLQSGLKDPLDRITQAVSQMGGDHSAAIGRVLTDAVSALTQRIQELFGGQIAGINQLQQQAVSALQAAVTKLEQMVSSVDSAGERATDAMTAKLTEALGAMEARQQVMNGQMAEFVEQIRNLVRDSQSETNRKLQETLSELGGTVTTMVTSLKEQAAQASHAHAERETRITDNTTHAITSLGGQVEAMLSKVTEVSGEIRSSVDAMRTVTTDVVNRMNSGAETLYVAASDFAKAGQGVAGVFTQATSVADRLSQAAGAVTTAARTLEAVVADYKVARETLASMFTQFESTVAAAKREAAITEDILSRIESATAKLTEAEREAEVYLERVSGVLGEAHQEFAENMRKTLGEANRQFYEQLTSATALLREGIQELDATLSEATVKR
jgi:DNA-directed RNA polymerase subunit F